MGFGDAGPGWEQDLCGWVCGGIVEILLHEDQRYVRCHLRDDGLVESCANVLVAAEEKLLVQFFGEDYRSYRRRVGTKIPFVP